MVLPVLPDKIAMPSSHRIFNFCLLMPRHLKEYCFHHWIVDDEAKVFGVSSDISALNFFLLCHDSKKTGHLFKDSCFRFDEASIHEARMPFHLLCHIRRCRINILDMIKRKYENVEKVFSWRIWPFRSLFNYCLYRYACIFARLDTLENLNENNNTACFLVYILADFIYVHFAQLFVYIIYVIKYPTL